MKERLIINGDDVKVSIPLHRYVKRESAISRLNQIKLLKEMYCYKDIPFRHICYYMSYLDKSATWAKEEFLKRKSIKQKIKFLSSLKKLLKECWLMGYFDDKDYLAYLIKLESVRQAIKNNKLTNYILSLIYGNI